MATESNCVFDYLAEAYDNDFSDTEVGKAQRGIVWEYLSNQLLVRVGHNCLEMNAGTGIDAAHLSQFGMNVIATDKSAGMMAFLKMRAHEHNFEAHNLEFNELSSHFSNREFDLLFSNFGGLNCVRSSDLKHLLKEFHSITKPGGRLIMVIMSKSCLWEKLYFSLKLKFNQAWRRHSKKGVPFEFGGESMKIHYFNPSDIIQLAGKEWDYQGSRPVGLFIPPSYLDSFFKKRRGFLERLINLDKRFSNPSLSRWADHYIIDFQRVA